MRIRSGKTPSAAPQPFGLRRMVALAILTALVVGAVTYMQLAVPLAAAKFAHAEATDYWQVALIAGLGVLMAAGAVAWLALGASRRRE